MGTARLLVPDDATTTAWVCPPPRDISAVTHMRARVLLATRAQLRTVGLTPTYQSALSPEARGALDALVASDWVPLELVHAHCAALDALELDEAAFRELFARSAEVLHKAPLAMALRLMREVGLTPWSLMHRLAPAWGQCFRGGATSVRRTGPKDAQLVFRADPLVRHRCHRVSLRMSIDLALKLLSPAVVVRELRDERGRESMVFQARWV